MKNIPTSREITWETIRANGRGLDEKTLRRKFDACSNNAERVALLREIVTHKRAQGLPMGKVSNAPNKL